jgi:hypothetical protein
MREPYRNRKRPQWFDLAGQLPKVSAFSAIMLTIAFASVTAAKADFQTFPLEVKIGWPEKEYSYTFRFDIPAEYRLDDRYYIKGDPVTFLSVQSKAYRIYFDLTYGKLEDDSLFKLNIEKNARHGYLGKDAAWSSYEFKDGDDSPTQTEYFLFARSCGGECTFEIRLPIGARDTGALFESFKRALLDGNYLQASRLDGGSDIESPVGNQTWLVVAGAWPESDRRKANERLALLKSGGITTAKIIKTDDYPNLTPGLFAVVVGPYPKDGATAKLETVQELVPDAFIKSGY